MPRSVRRLTTAFAVAVIGLTGCGGGGTTTVINKTVVTEPQAGSNRAALTYLPSPWIERKYVEPAFYSFVVDGSLLGKHLTWKRWGSPIATGTGTIEERNWASGNPRDRRSYRGSVMASGLERCKGRSYYTQVVAQVPSNAVYVPEEATQLTTPCRTFRSTEEEKSGQSYQQRPRNESSLTFQTPSGNIGCSIGQHEVFCTILKISWTPPAVPADCEPPASESWGHTIQLKRHGPTFLCTDQGVISPGGESVLPILAYGKAVTRGPFTCESHPQALVCTTGRGRGILLSVQRVKLF